LVLDELAPLGDPFGVAAVQQLQVIPRVVPGMSAGIPAGRSSPRFRARLALRRDDGQVYRPWNRGEGYVSGMATESTGPAGLMAGHEDWCNSLRAVQTVFQTEPVPDALAQAILAKVEGNPRDLQHSAHGKVISHLTTAVELLKTLPDTPGCALQELGLHTALGAALIVARGHAAPEVEHTYARPRDCVRNSARRRTSSQGCEDSSSS
jgi:hypothetical protein